MKNIRFLFALLLFLAGTMLLIMTLGDLLAYLSDQRMNYILVEGIVLKGNAVIIMIVFQIIIALSLLGLAYKINAASK